MLNQIEIDTLSGHGVMYSHALGGKLGDLADSTLIMFTQQRVTRYRVVFTDGASYGFEILESIAIYVQNG